MSLFPRLRSGLRTGLRTGLNAIDGAPPATQNIAAILDASDPGQFLIDRMGFANKPMLMWGGREASGATEIITGTDDLSDVGAPSKEVADPNLDATVTTFSDNTAESMDAASNTVADVGNETITVLWIGRFLAEGAALQLMGKRDPAGSNIGYELVKAAGGFVEWNVDTLFGLVTRSVEIDHGIINPQVILATHSFANDVQSLWTLDGADEGTRTQETMTNTATFAMGSQRVNAAGSNFALGAVWIGTDGDNLNNTHRFNLAEWLSYEV